MFQNESNKLNHIMQNNLIDKQLVDTTMAQCGVSNLDDASIRDTVKIANLLEKATGEKFIRMEMGVPGLAPSRIGTEAEIEALKHGVAQFYPMLEGYPVLSEEASRFVKNFMDVDIRPEGIIPTVGAMQASYVAFMALTECHKGKDTILFIDPGFPVQKTQLEVIGKPYQTFDIYEYREEKLEAKLREYLDRGNIAGIVYSNPNNPSWVCLTDFELQVIGKLATEYDTIILGYPNWWASIPMPVASFLEEYNFSGKTIIPFCSHGGGRFGQSLTAITKLVPDAAMGEALSVHYSGDSGLSSDIADWLEENNIK